MVLTADTVNTSIIAAGEAQIRMEKATTENNKRQAIKDATALYKNKTTTLMFTDTSDHLFKVNTLIAVTKMSKTIINTLCGLEEKDKVAVMVAVWTDLTIDDSADSERLLKALENNPPVTLQEFKVPHHYLITIPPIKHSPLNHPKTVLESSIFEGYKATTLLNDLPTMSESGYFDNYTWNKLHDLLTPLIDQANFAQLLLHNIIRKVLESYPHSALPAYIKAAEKTTNFINIKSLSFPNRVAATAFLEEIKKYMTASSEKRGFLTTETLSSIERRMAPQNVSAIMNIHCAKMEDNMAKSLEKVEAVMGLIASIKTEPTLLKPALKPSKETRFVEDDRRKRGVSETKSVESIKSNRSEGKNPTIPHFLPLP